MLDPLVPSVQNPDALALNIYVKKLYYAYKTVKQSKCLDKCLWISDGEKCPKSGLVSFRILVLSGFQTLIVFFIDF